MAFLFLFVHIILYTHLCTLREQAYIFNKHHDWREVKHENVPIYILQRTKCPVKEIYFIYRAVLTKENSSSVR